MVYRGSKSKIRNLANPAKQRKLQGRHGFCPEGWPSRITLQVVRSTDYAILCYIIYYHIILLSHIILYYVVITSHSTILNYLILYYIISLLLRPKDPKPSLDPQDLRRGEQSTEHP